MELEAQPSLDDELGTFPSDPSRDVCPTDAINWDAAGEMPTIEAESCIGCGLCAVRCPYGAISLSPDGIAVVVCASWAWASASLIRAIST